MGMALPTTERPPESTLQRCNEPAASGRAIPQTGFVFGESACATCTARCWRRERLLPDAQACEEYVSAHHGYGGPYITAGPD